MGIINLTKIKMNNICQNRLFGTPAVADHCCQLSYTLTNNQNAYVNMCELNTYYEIMSNCNDIKNFDVICGDSVKATYTGNFGYNSKLMLSVHDKNHDHDLNDLKLYQEEN